ncbi:MAG: ABC transporter permease [Meiothermus sp.]|nr:ABC transporter permease [Meiothermus sp.]
MSTVSSKHTDPDALSARPSSFWQDRRVRRFRRNRLAVFGFITVVFFLLIAVFAPLLAPPPAVGNNCLRDLGGSSSTEVYNPTSAVFWKAMFFPPASCYLTARVNFSQQPTPPLASVQSDAGELRPIMGTSSGYDIWYGLIWGTRTALLLAVSVVFAQLLIGIALGGISGYYGGWVDNLIQRIIDVIFAFPSLVLVIVFTTLLGKSLPNVIIAFVMVGWAGYARIVRAEVLKVRSLEFVDGARALGASDLRIIFRHVLPNALTALLAIVVLDLGSVPLSAAALSFLGIGLPPGYADWGQIINSARAWLQGPPGQPWAYWYVSFFPAFTIILFGLGWNLLGDALRDALDPRNQ